MPQQQKRTPPRPCCALPYHRPGALVRLQRWRGGQMQNLVGAVIAHREHHRVITVATPAGEITMSCGSVIPA